jgi:hypothetical protein
MNHDRHNCSCNHPDGDYTNFAVLLTGIRTGQVNIIEYIHSLFEANTMFLNIETVLFLISFKPHTLG